MRIIHWYMNEKPTWIFKQWIWSNWLYQGCYHSSTHVCLSFNWFAHRCSLFGIWNGYTHHHSSFHTAHKLWMKMDYIVMPLIWGHNSINSCQYTEYSFKIQITSVHCTWSTGMRLQLHDLWWLNCSVRSTRL